MISRDAYRHVGNWRMNRLIVDLTFATRVAGVGSQHASSWHGRHRDSDLGPRRSHRDSGEHTPLGESLRALPLSGPGARYDVPAPRADIVLALVGAAV